MWPYFQYDQDHLETFPIPAVFVTINIQEAKFVIFKVCLKNFQYLLEVLFKSTLI